MKLMILPHQKENPVIQDPLNIDDIDMENEPNTSIGPSENMNVTIEPNIPLWRSTWTRKPVVKLNLWKYYKYEFKFSLYL